MGRLKPLILQGNIWEKQEDETPKQNYFKNLFIRTGEETVVDFASRINHEYNTNGLDGFLAYKPYTEFYFLELATAHKWLERRDAFQEYNNAKLFSELDVIENDRKIERYSMKEDLEYEALDWLVNRVKGRDIKLTGGQFKDTTQGIRNLQDSRNIDREKPTEYGKQEFEGKVDAAAEVNTTSKINLDPKSIADRDLQLMKEFMESKE